MSARPTAKAENTTDKSTDSDDIIMVTKTAWYKEASGVVAVIGWTTLIFLWSWALLAGANLEQWWFLLTVVVVALTASMYRQASSKISVEKVEL